MLVASLSRVNDEYAKLIDRISKKKLAWLVASVVLINLLITALFAYVLFPNHSAVPEFESMIEQLLLVVIVTPLVETALVQYGIINYVLRKKPGAVLLACFISSLIFAAFHHYSVAYVCKTFLSGFLYGTLYLTAMVKNSHAFLVTAIAHSLYNTFGFLITTFLAK